MDTVAQELAKELGYKVVGENKYLLQPSTGAWIGPDGATELEMKLWDALLAARRRTAELEQAIGQFGIEYEFMPSCAAYRETARSYALRRTLPAPPEVK